MLQVSWSLFLCLMLVSTGPDRVGSRLDTLKIGPSKNLTKISLKQSHRIHGSGVFSYIWLIFIVNVGLGGGFKYFLFSSLSLGKMNPI